MKRILMCSIMVLMAIAAQAQMGVEKAVANLEQQWTAAAKMSNADGVAPLLADNFVNMNSDGTMRNKAQTLETT